MEHLDKNFDAVVEQLEKIRQLIAKLDIFEERYKTDPDVDHYIDEENEKIEDAFQNFTINNKIVDIERLVKDESTTKKKFNAIIYAVNDYIEYNMIGQGKSNLNEI